MNKKFLYVLFVFTSIYYTILTMNNKNGSVSSKFDDKPNGEEKRGFYYTPPPTSPSQSCPDFDRMTEAEKKKTEEEKKTQSDSEVEKKNK